MCPASHREMSVISRSSVRVSGLVDIGREKHILTDPPRAPTRQRDGLAERRDETRPFTAELRRDEEQQLVDEVGPEEGACQGRAAFEQERLHVLAPQASEL